MGCCHVDDAIDRAVLIAVLKHDCRRSKELIEVEKHSSGFKWRDDALFQHWHHEALLKSLQLVEIVKLQPW